MVKPKPSSREKKRYVVFELLSEKKHSFSDAKDALQSICQRYIGEFGIEKAKLYLIKNLYNENRGVFRVTLKGLNEVKASLEKLTTINKTKTKVRILGISGILKKARYKFLEKNSRGE